MNEIKRYVNTVERHLHLDRATRLRVMNDLDSDLQSRLEAGESLAEIQAELGDARTLADTLNREFADHRDNASPWRWAFLALAVFLVLVLAVQALTVRQTYATIGVIGGADGPTAIFVATQRTLIDDLHGIFWPVTLVGGYCLFGPARRGSRRRLFVPMVLCGAALLVQIVWFFCSVWAIGGDISFLLPLWGGTFVRSGIWLSGWLLWRTVHEWRRR